MVGVGRRALRVRRVRLAFERRDVIFSGGGGGEEFNCDRIDRRCEAEADMMGIWLELEELKVWLATHFRRSFTTKLVRIVWLMGWETVSAR